jgi:pseudaminic acid synthase
MNIKINNSINFSYNKPPLIIAEISSNHNGSKKKFIDLINCAYDNGADLVKIQTYEPQDITFSKNNSIFFIKKGIWHGKQLWNLYQKAHTPFSWHEEAFKIAKKRRKIIFSTPFSIRALKFLKKFNPPIYKISSFEITDLNLINEISKIKKPIILSTGASNLNDIKNAVNIIKKHHNKIILLHCVSTYPTPIEGANIRKINYLKKNFSNSLIGLSDHSSGISSSLSATALGVVAIEKHVKLNENSKSEDSKFSISMKSLKELSKLSKEVFFSLGTKDYKKKVSKEDKETQIYRRSIYAARDIKKGERFTKNNIKTLRPALGILANNYFKLLGKKSNKNILAENVIKNSMLKTKLK